MKIGCQKGKWHQHFNNETSKTQKRKKKKTKDAKWGNWDYLRSQSLKTYLKKKGLDGYFHN